MFGALPIFLLIAIPLATAAPYCALVPPTSYTAAVTPSSNNITSAGLPSPINGKNTNSSSSVTEVVAASWYAGWHGSDFPPSNVSWSKYSSVSYTFATTTSDSSMVVLASSDQELLPTFVSLAHQNGVDAILTIGGWSGSQYFSSNVGSPENQTAFVAAVLDLVSQYDLDGVDFDWEYPGGQGIGCNVMSSNDSNNFLSFLQALRAEPAATNLTISAAVSITPFIGTDGSPMTDVSQFAEVLDYIEIMNYDVWGSWSTAVGPNSPLNDTCAPAGDQDGSAVSAVNAWTAAGFPAEQIVLGVASYGHSFDVTPTNAILSNGTLASYPPFDAQDQPAGDAWDSPAGVDECGTEEPAGGIFDFWGMIGEGFLTTNGTAAPGIYYRYDDCSQTPYVYNSTSQVMISYDDATSFAAKGDFIVQSGLRGFMMWQTGGDYDDILLDSISNAIGIEEDDC